MNSIVRGMPLSVGPDRGRGPVVVVWMRAMTETGPYGARQATTKVGPYGGNAATNEIEVYEEAAVR